MKTIKFAIVAILLLNIGLFVACSDDDDMAPITLRNYEEAEPNLNLIYPTETDEHHFRIQGGDENYSVISDNPEIIFPEIIQQPAVSSSDLNLRLKVQGIGKAKLTITDKSKNSLILHVTADYKTEKFIVKKHDIRVFGGDLTDNEKKAISEKYLAEIPVKVNGGYEFIFTDVANNKSKAIIYTDSYGSKGIETTFEMKEIKDKVIPESASWAYEVIINNEKRTFVQGRYIPSTKATETVTVALMEDITQNVQVEYPKAELVYTSQVIVRSSY